MNDDLFSIEPVSEAELKELTGPDPMLFIKRKLAEACLHVQNAHEVRQIADKQELSDEDFYAVLAYRVLADVLRTNHAAIAAQAAHASDPRIIMPDSALDIE